MSLSFRISVQGDKVAASMIEGLGTQAKNPRAALEEIYLTVLDIVGETFDKEGARGGFPKWANVTLDTLVRKVKRGSDPRILRDTSELYRGMTSYRSSGHLARIDRFGITFMPSSVKGRAHQRGAPSVNLPARPFIRFTETDRQAFAREILRHIVKRHGRSQARIV